MSADGSCPDSSCGGVACKDSNDKLVCGGPHCNGTVGESIRALEKANDLSKNLTAVSEDLMNMAKKVCVYVQKCVCVQNISLFMFCQF